MEGASAGGAEGVTIFRWKGGEKTRQLGDGGIEVDDVDGLRTDRSEFTCEESITPAEN